MSKKLNKISMIANSKRSQHKIFDLENQMILLNRLHKLHELKLLNKRVLCACLLLTKEHGDHVLKCLGFSINSDSESNYDSPEAQIHSTRIPPIGK